MENINQHSFDCCHLWYLCNYGINGCEWGKSRPEKMEACTCYKRNFNNKQEDNINSEQTTTMVEINIADETKRVDKKVLKSKVEEQLSLF